MMTPPLVRLALLGLLAGLGTASLPVCHGRRSCPTGRLKRVTVRCGSSP